MVNDKKYSPNFKRLALSGLLLLLSTSPLGCSMDARSTRCKSGQLYLFAQEKLENNRYEQETCPNKNPDGSMCGIHLMGYRFSPKKSHLYTGR